jgi:DNA-binding response OmpR family regulator
MATVVDDRATGLAMGAADYFVKPVNRSQLLARLAEQIVPPAAPDHGAAVLAIADDPDTLQTLTASLQSHGYTVTTPTNGPDGLKRSREQPFDLIITDLAMRGPDGLDLIHALHNDTAIRQVPVLLLTAPEPTPDGAAATHGKVIGILPNGHAIQDALHDWLANHAAPPHAPPEAPSSAPPMRHR